MSVLDSLFPTVLNLFNIGSKKSPPSPAPIDPHAAIQAQLDRMQAKLNPYINKANANASAINKYVTSPAYLAANKPPAYSPSNPSLSSGNVGSVGTGYSPPNASMQSYLPQQSTDWAGFMPILNQLQASARRKNSTPISMDLSPYLQAAETIRNRRTANQEGTLYV